MVVQEHVGRLRRASVGRLSPELARSSSRGSTVRVAHEGIIELLRGSLDPGQTPDARRAARQRAAHVLEQLSRALGRSEAVPVTDLRRLWGYCVRELGSPDSPCDEPTAAHVLLLLERLHASLDRGEPARRVQAA